MARTAEEVRAQMAELQSELDAIEAAEKQAKEAERGKAVIAKVSALKALYSTLKADYEDGLPVSWRDTNQQALPRETLIGRRFGLSESEVHNAKEKGRQAIQKL